MEDFGEFITFMKDLLCLYEGEPINKLSTCRALNRVFIG